MNILNGNGRTKLLWVFFFIFNLLFTVAVIKLPAQIADFSSNLSQFKLRNGLQVILYEDSSVPLVSVVVAYSVGSINDPENKPGLAFFMQHLMFQGSRNVGPMQHITYIQNIGGELNAATTFDKTFFYETVPANQLGLVLWLESDRMSFLEINEAAVDRIKEMLINNERQRNLQEPYTRYFFLIDQILFPDSYYGHTLPGSEEAIKSFSLDEIIDFYKRYYVPNNAVLCISGDIRPDKVKELVTRYFETIPRGPEINSSLFSNLKLSFSARDQIIYDSMISIPALQFGIRFDDWQPEDRLLFKTLEYILLNGRTSRLFNRLVDKDRLALYLTGGLDERRPYLSLKLFLLANNKTMIDRSKKIIQEEFSRLKNEMISEMEMDKIRNRYKFNLVNRFAGTNLSRSLALAESYLSDGKLPDPVAELSSLDKITPYSILSLSRRFLKEEKYCFITILPR
ncbi:MAG: M16 family metallopeptidase [Candidatus Saccharicenans sp.]